MKIFSSSYDFDYPWEEVSIANWRKYSPWNKESDHVVAVDTLSRSIDAKTGILRTERLITCRQGSPRWLKPFLGNAEVSHVYEVSYVKPPKPSPLASAAAATTTTGSTVSSNSLSATDPTDAVKSISRDQPSVTMTSQNLTWSDILSVRETVVYTPSPTDPLRKTQFSQDAKIVALCGGWQKVREKIEAFTMERFGQNAARGRKGFEEVLEMSRRAFGEEREKQKQLAMQQAGPDAKVTR